MPDAVNPETLLFFLFFTVPGIVALFFRAQFLAGRIPSASEALISYVPISLAYQAIVFPLTLRLYAAERFTDWLWAAWIALIFVGPAIVGLLLGLNIRKGWIRHAIARLGLATVHPVSCAWDWRFSQCQAGWVIAQLKDGTKWHGFVGPNSFMSSDPGERDLLIEAVYNSNSEGAAWAPRGSAVWLAHGEIQSLEFLPYAGAGAAGSVDEKITPPTQSEGE